MIIEIITIYSVNVQFVHRISQKRCQFLNLPHYFSENGLIREGQPESLNLFNHVQSGIHPNGINQTVPYFNSTETSFSGSLMKKKS